MWLEILPGIVICTGGLTLLASWLPLAIFAAWVVALGGAWSAVGGAPSLVLETRTGTVALGTLMACTVTRALVESQPLDRAGRDEIVFLAALSRAAMRSGSGTRGPASVRPRRMWLPR